MIAVGKELGGLVSIGWIRMLSNIYLLKDETPCITISLVSKKANINYPWACHMVYALEKRGVIKTKKTDRRTLLYLTPFGEEVCRAANLLEGIANGWHEQRDKKGSEDVA
jgi:predicted transcriptional regulator